MAVDYDDDFIIPTADLQPGRYLIETDNVSMPADHVRVLADYTRVHPLAHGILPILAGMGIGFIMGLVAASIFYIGVMTR